MKLTFLNYGSSLWDRVTILEHFIIFTFFIFVFFNILNLLYGLWPDLFEDHLIQRGFFLWLMNDMMRDLVILLIMLRNMNGFLTFLIVLILHIMILLYLMYCRCILFIILFILSEYLLIVNNLWSVLSGVWIWLVCVVGFFSVFIISHACFIRLLFLSWTMNWSIVGEGTDWRDRRLGDNGGLVGMGRVGTVWISRVLDMMSGFMDRVGLRGGWELSLLLLSILPPTNLLLNLWSLGFGLFWLRLW